MILSGKIIVFYSREVYYDQVVIGFQDTVTLQKRDFIYEKNKNHMHNRTGQ